MLCQIARVENRNLRDAVDTLKEQVILLRSQQERRKAAAGRTIAVIRSQYPGLQIGDAPPASAIDCKSLRAWSRRTTPEISQLVTFTLAHLQFCLV